MNQKLVIIAVVVVLLLVAIIGLVLLGGTKVGV